MQRPRQRPLVMAPGARRGWRFADPVLALATLAGTALLFESGARMLGWGQIVEFARDSHWGYLMRPTQTVWSFGLPVRINTLGLRGPEVQAPSRERKRVLFVGDSITYGGGRVAEGELFCRLFESQARQRRLDVETVNLSAPGWSPQNWRAYLERNGLLGADGVVIVLPEVDLTRPFSVMEFHGFRERAPRLRLTGFVLRAILAARPPPRPSRDVPATIRANVEAVAFAKRLSADRPFLVVLLPSPMAPAPPEAWASFEAEWPDALDLRPEMKGRPLFLDGLHLNRQGHRLVAARLLERLFGPLGNHRWVIPPPCPP